MSVFGALRPDCRCEATIGEAVCVMFAVCGAHAYAFHRLICRGHRDPNIHMVVESFGVWCEDHVIYVTIETVRVGDSRYLGASDMAPTGGGIFMSAGLVDSGRTSLVTDLVAGSLVGVETMAEVNLDLASTVDSCEPCVVGAMCTLPGA